MAIGKAKKWGIIGLVVVVVLLVGAVVGFRMAVQMVKGKVLEALGPESEIKELRVDWNSVDVEGLRIKGGQGWPAADTLRAERVVVVPALRSLLSGEIQVRSITVVKPYLSALRTKDGKLRVLPSLLEKPAAPAKEGGGAAGPAVSIGRITLQDAVVELYDATVAQPPLKIRMEQIQASVRNVLVPALTGKTRFELAGIVKGVQKDGRANLAGWTEVATKDSSVNTEIRSLDLLAFQPYLSKSADVRVQKGLLDLDLQSEVSQNRLKAPGKVALSDLELAPGRGPFDTFMGMPRAAVINFLKNKNNKIEVKFILEGDINNPQFALNEAFATRIASSMAESMGVSIRGVAEGIGTLGPKGGQAVGEAAKGVGGALGEFLGRKKQ